MNVMVLLILGIFTLADARAYSPPAPFVVSRALKERKGLRGIEWTAKVVDSRTQSGFKETLRFDFQTGRGLAQYVSLSDEPLGSHVLESTALSKLGKFWIGIALDPNGARVRAALAELGLLPEDLQMTKLVRLGRQVAWEWGEGSRILFLKDEFRPLALFLKDAEALSSLQFDAFSLAGSSAQVPRSVRILRGSSELFRFELKTTKTDGGGARHPPAAPRVDLPLLREWVSLVR